MFSPSCKWHPYPTSTLKTMKTKISIVYLLVQIAVQLLNAFSENHRIESLLGIVSKCLYSLQGGADGKLGWDDCKQIVQDFYENYVKK
jgi:hypothetical protein